MTPPCSARLRRKRIGPGESGPANAVFVRPDGCGVVGQGQFSRPVVALPSWHQGHLGAVALASSSIGSRSGWRVRL